MPQLYLIDGSSQMYRAYHAIRGLTGPDGRSTNAVYGFSTMLRKLVQDQQPAFMAAAFDLAEQVGLVREACQALGVPVLTCAGFEADDVIGTVAVQALTRDFDVAIVT